MFEGTPAQFTDSLGKLAALPDDTLVYCAHEYTLSNLRFAQAVEPFNAALTQRVKAETAKRQRNEPTVPSTIGLEKATNPFLRYREPEIIGTLVRQQGLEADAPAVKAFATLRQWKNQF